MTVISAADPLNLIGTLTSGERVRAVTSTTIAFRRGVAVAVREGDYIRPLVDLDASDAAGVAIALAGRSRPAILSGGSLEERVVLERPAGVARVVGVRSRAVRISLPVGLTRRRVFPPSRTRISAPIGVRGVGCRLPLRFPGRGRARIPQAEQHDCDSHVIENGTTYPSLRTHLIYATHVPHIRGADMHLRPSEGIGGMRQERTQQNRVVCAHRHGDRRGGVRVEPPRANGLSDRTANFKQYRTFAIRKANSSEIR